MLKVFLFTLPLYFDEVDILSWKLPKRHKRFKAKTCNYLPYLQLVQVCLPRCWKYPASALYCHELKLTASLGLRDPLLLWDQRRLDYNWNPEVLQDPSSCLCYWVSNDLSSQDKYVEESEYFENLNICNTLLKASTCKPPRWTLWTVGQTYIKICFNKKNVG